MRRKEVQSLSDVVSYLDRFPDQTTDRCLVEGQEYRHFLVAVPFRPGDENVAVPAAAMMFSLAINQYLDSEVGTIYWGDKPEQAFYKAPRVVRYDKDGPDFDPIEDKKCYMDRNWKMIKMYCRVLRSDKLAIAATAA